MCVQGVVLGSFSDAVLSILSSVAITSIRMRDMVALLYFIIAVLWLSVLGVSFSWCCVFFYIFPDKDIYERKIAIIFFPINLNMCLGAQKNRLIETIL